jgi:hypothetical protein
MRRTIPTIGLLMGACILAITYTGVATLSPEDPPETAVIGSLAKIYQPVTFSHGMHALVADDCASCHHHSEPDQTPSCKECHGSRPNIPKLKDAYHGQCMGCHKEMGMGPTSCAECHTKKVAQKAPMKKKPEKKKPERGPEVSVLNSVRKISEYSRLETKYEPVTFSHGMHTLVADDCATCHHHSEPGQTPSCKECHGAPFDPKNLKVPGLKGAYHLQCMGCHNEMGGPTGCTGCHAKKEVKTIQAETK